MQQHFDVDLAAGARRSPSPRGQKDGLRRFDSVAWQARDRPDVRQVGAANVVAGR